MSSELTIYAAEHRALLEAAARQAGFADPVAVSPGPLYWPLLKKARKRALVPLDGVLIRDWTRTKGYADVGAVVGARLGEVEGIRFALVRCQLDYNQVGHNFLAVERADYLRLYKLALRCGETAEPPAPQPILPATQAEALWRNTIGFLDAANLRRIREYGGRPRRGVLLTGPPGNGKTMACRWVWEECRRRHWEYRVVTPSLYRQARASCNAEEAVRSLFSVGRCGVVFFDDMDVALRDRETVSETDDQAVFLTALDGLRVQEGVVYVFTTNCSLDLIDRAFKRPGRIDLVLHFEAPDAALRLRLLQRWHADIRAALCLDEVVAVTDGFSFAELEELKNLLILRYLEAGEWDWGWAREQFLRFRAELAADRRRQVGFGLPEPAANGACGDE